MAYEYQVRTQGASMMDNLERYGERLQQALNQPQVAASEEAGWELWQVHTLKDAEGVNGLIFVYRRPRP
jgi:hypothetical protein